MSAIEYVINDKKMICLNVMHFDYGNGLQTTPTTHEITCIKLKLMDSKIVTILSKLEHLSDTYKCSSVESYNNLEIRKIGPILEQTTFTLTILKEQIASQHYNIVKSKLTISDGMDIFKSLNNYSTNNLHEAFEKNDSITNIGWLGTFIFGIGAIGFIIADEHIKNHPIFSGFNVFATFTGLVITVAAAYQYHNEITHRIADINYDLEQLSIALGNVGEFIDG